MKDYYNIKEYDALFRMSEEYCNLVAPFVERLSIESRWDEIASPLLRVAEMNQEVIKGAVKAINEIESEIVLIGNEEIINNEIKKLYGKNNIKEILT